MKFKVIQGLYKHYKTHWYYGHDNEGNIYVSTRSKEVPLIDGEDWLWREEEMFVCYCPKCQKVHCFERHYSDFYVKAMERARDCEEYEALKKLFIGFPKLAKKLLLEGKDMLMKQDVGYVVERVKNGASFGLIERYFNIPDEVRVRLIARFL